MFIFQSECIGAKNYSVLVSFTQFWSVLVRCTIGPKMTGNFMLRASTDAGVVQRMTAASEPSRCGAGTSDELNCSIDVQNCSSHLLSWRGSPCFACSLLVGRGLSGGDYVPILLDIRTKYLDISQWLQCRTQGLNDVRMRGPASKVVEHLPIDAGL